MFCPYCARARSLLAKKGVDYSDIDVMADTAKRDEMIGALGRPPDRAADLHRRPACRRLRRAGGARPRRQARRALGPRAAMSKVFQAACVQLTSGPDDRGQYRGGLPISSAARATKGADFILTPEVSDMIEPKRDLRLDKAKPESGHSMLAAFRALARETGAWLLLGSAVVRDPGARASVQPLLPHRARRARSSSATTRSTCSTSISRPAKATANPRPTAPATRPRWPSCPGACSA